MASSNQVKKYLAYWFQLGKKVLIRGGRDTLLPQPVISGDRYSQQFEECWSQIQSSNSGDCYLEGSDQTIAELLTDQWELEDCSRCAMPIPVQSVGLPALTCPCHDLSGWPNQELPQPRSPIDSTERLNDIRQRLLKTNPYSNHT
jgi:hypothetical protein